MPLCLWVALCRAHALVFWGRLVCSKITARVSSLSLQRTTEGVLPGVLGALRALESMLLNTAARWYFAQVEQG